jgi:hypothetical protein
MKLRLASIVAAAAILAGAYPFVQLQTAAQGGGASQVGADTELDGTVEVLYEDGWDAPRLKHFLHIGTDRIELDFGGKVPRHLRTGSRVRAHGKLRGGKLALRETDVAALGGSGTVSDPGATGDLASANTFGVQSTLVILFNFTDLSTQPYTTAAAQSAVFTDVNNFDLENSSQQTSLTGIVRGWYPIASASTACNYNTWASQAEAAATAAGVDLSQYPRRVFGFPQTAACNWWGLGTIGGGTVANPSRAWVNGLFNLRVVSHEMGHNFGLYHSHSNTCDGTGCIIDDYGDDHDTMGGGPSSIVGHFNAYQKERLGWLNYMASPPIQTVTAPGQYVIEPYATPWGGNPKALKILKITGGGSSTYIYAEARTQFGIDSALAPGVIIHTGIDTDGTQSNEQDLQPTTAVTDFLLSPGQSYTFADAQPSSVTLTTLSSDSTGAVLDVSMACGYALSSTGQTVPATGGGGSVDVTTGAACNWTATSDSAWLTLNTGSTSGTGPATVSFTAATNPNSSARTGTLTIGTQTYTVTQAGSTCTYSILPTSQFFTYTGGSGTVNVTTLGGCNWTATSNAPWLTITGGSSGSGSGPVTYSVASQSSAHVSRTGTLTVAGQTFTVTQEGLAAQFITPANGSTTVSTSWNFGWTQVGGLKYILLVGTTPGGSDILNTGELNGTTTSNLVSNMPASRLLFARVRTKWSTNQFTNADISFTTLDRLTGVTVLGSQAPSPVIAGSTAQYGAGASTSVKASFTGSGGGCTVTMSATGLPTGATATFTPSSFPSSAVDQFTLMTIATTAATPAGSYTVTVRGQESVPCGSAVMTTTAPLNVSGATSLAAATATGTYGGTVNLSATLTSGGSPVSAKSVAFTLNGAGVGSAVTDASGVATLSNVAMTGIGAASYPTGVAASFAGDASFGGSSGNNSLTVNQRSVTPSVTAANKTYNGTTAATLTGCTLSGVIGGDVVTCTGGTATFATAAVGTAKTVTATGLGLSGAQAGNYTLSSTTATTTANITGASVTPRVTAPNMT